MIYFAVREGAAKTKAIYFLIPFHLIYFALIVVACVEPIGAFCTSHKVYPEVSRIGTFCFLALYVLQLVFRCNHYFLDWSVKDEMAEKLKANMKVATITKINRTEKCHILFE